MCPDGILHLSTRSFPARSWANHFDPLSPIFTKKERVEVLISDIALGVVVAGLVALGRAFGWIWLFKTYGVPYLVVNHWLVGGDVRKERGIREGLGWLAAGCTACRTYWSITGWWVT